MKNSSISFTFWLLLFSLSNQSGLELEKVTCLKNYEYDHKKMLITVTRIFYDF